MNIGRISPGYKIASVDLRPKDSTTRKLSHAAQNSKKESSMKSSRFTEEQIIKVLKQGETGMPVKELCRQHGISNGTYYKWKAKFGGMELSDAKKLRGLEQENSRLKRMIADLMLDNQILKDVNSKKWEASGQEGRGQLHANSLSSKRTACLQAFPAIEIRQ